MAQEKIKKALESEHYASFIVTDLYAKLLEELDEEESKKGKFKLW